mmetsp:Transcript_15763/g.39997  ORF Transcript_15763/g.39997 Transcript_15763/m.39997 type:complete len:306 (+) Transcript_15763:92-1009(+)
MQARVISSSSSSGGGGGGGACATTYEHGAHLTGWKASFDGDGDAVDVIFTSGSAIFKPPKAIRGGIPVCWPQFANYGPLELQHGFARNCAWKVTDEKEGSIEYTLTYDDIDDEQKAMVPGPFTLKIRHVVVDGTRMRTYMSVTNESEKELEFTTALHTYFVVGDITKTSVSGCKGLSYLDAPPHGSASSDRVLVDEDKDEKITFAGELDRIYFNTPNEVVIHDDARSLEIVVRKSIKGEEHLSELPDAVVWNPWIDKSKATGDLGDDEYKGFVCVETASVKDKIKVPARGGTWSTAHEIEVIRKK